MAGNRHFVISTNRLENFSDGVFTIVLTLLAFQFKVPKLSTDLNMQANVQELLRISPYMIGFAFSFNFCGGILGKSSPSLFYDKRSRQQDVVV